MIYGKITITRLGTDSSIRLCQDSCLDHEAFHSFLDDDFDEKTGFRELIPMSDDSYVAAVHRLATEAGLLEKVWYQGYHTHALAIRLSYDDKSEPARLDRESWERKNMAWLIQTFGKQSIIEAHGHYDEFESFIHVFVVPIVNGFLDDFRFIGSTEKIIKLENSYTDAMQEFDIAQTHIEVVSHYEKPERNETHKTEATICLLEKSTELLDDILRLLRKFERK